MKLFSKRFKKKRTSEENC